MLCAARVRPLTVTRSEEPHVTLRLLAVHAHPDDESSKGAATYAHYVADGRRGAGRVAAPAASPATS